MKKCIAFLMTCLLMFFSPVLTLASTNELDFYLEPYRQEEQRRIDEITNSENSAEWLNVERDNMPLSNGMMTIGHCLDCATIGVTVCAAEAKLVNEGYHRGFFGNQTDCYTPNQERTKNVVRKRCGTGIDRCRHRLPCQCGIRS